MSNISPSKPSFLLTYYNPFDKNAPGLVDSYLDYAKDVNLAKYSAGIVSDAIEKASKAELKLMEDGFKMLDQRMSMLVYQQISTNLLLEDIKELLRLPDSEKEKLFHIQSGLKFLSKISRNADVIFDAISEFEKALIITPQDWFVNYHLGICHLHYPNALNLEKSKKYFITAIKYASIEDNYSLQSSFKAAFYSVENQDKKLEYPTIWPEKTSYSNPERWLKENWFLPNDDEFYDLLTAPFFHLKDSYLNLSQIEYIFGNYEDAYQNVEKAYLYDFIDSPGYSHFDIERLNDKIRFFTAKYGARANTKESKYRAEWQLKDIESISLLEAAKHDIDILMLPAASTKVDSTINKNKKEVENSILRDELYNSYRSINTLVNLFVKDWIDKQNFGLKFHGESYNIRKLDKSPFDFLLSENEDYKVENGISKVIDEFDQLTKFLYETFSSNQSAQLFLKRSHDFVEISCRSHYWLGKNNNEMEHYLEVQKYTEKEKRKIIEAKIKWDEIIGLLPIEFDQQYILQKYTDYGGFLECEASFQKMINNKLKNPDSRVNILDKVKNFSYLWQIVFISIGLYFYSQGDKKWGFIGVCVGIGYGYNQWLGNRKNK